MSELNSALNEALLTNTPKGKALDFLVDKAESIIDCRRSILEAIKEEDFEMADYFKKRAAQHARNAFWFVKGYTLAQQECLCTAL